MSAREWFITGISKEDGEEWYAGPYATEREAESARDATMVLGDSVRVRVTDEQPRLGRGE